MAINSVLVPIEKNSAELIHDEQLLKLLGESFEINSDLFDPSRVGTLIRKATEKNSSDYHLYAGHSNNCPVTGKKYLTAMPDGKTVYCYACRAPIAKLYALNSQESK